MKRTSLQLFSISEVHHAKEFNDTEDPGVIADGIRQVPQTLDCALNSTSSNRRNAKGGVQSMDFLNSRFKEIVTTNPCYQEVYHW